MSPYEVPDERRSVRNNNPGNVRIGQPWQGLMSRDRMSAEQAAETQFCVFLTPAMGFRAMAEIFHTYYDKDNVRTLEQAISRWAPPTENNTVAYVEDVCAATGYTPDALFPFRGQPATQASLLKAVSIHEAGGWFFTQEDLLTGVRAAA